jgi:6-pyruvoyltetrahydropterin/6-carboxytetrahydropterin synthase
VAFSIRVEGIGFEAAHFATYRGQCEPLHGHSYSVAAEVEGDLTADSWVMDFGRLKEVLREACSRLDHKFLLQRESRELKVDQAGRCWKVQTPAGADYAFPLEDVAVLPVDNSTAERLAEYLAGELWRALQRPGEDGVRRLSVEVWEGHGQRGRYQRERLPLD